MEQENKGLQKTNEEGSLKKTNGTLPWLPVWNSLTLSAQEHITAVVKMSSPQLHEFGVNAKMNEPEGTLLFRSQINSLVKFFAADWDADMSKEAARIAYQEANWMTVAEVKYFMSRMKAGKYPHKKNLSPAVFMECLNDYTHEVLATRGAVNSYAWRDNRIPDEQYTLPFDPQTKEPGKPVDPDVMKRTIAAITTHIQEAARRQQEQDDQDRKARWQALKNNRDQQLVDLVERDASQGIAPDKYMTKAYFTALKNLSEK